MSTLPETSKTRVINLGDNRRVLVLEQGKNKKLVVAELQKGQNSRETASSLVNANQDWQTLERQEGKHGPIARKRAQTYIYDGRIKRVPHDLLKALSPTELMVALSQSKEQTCLQPQSEISKVVIANIVNNGNDDELAQLVEYFLNQKEHDFPTSLAEAVKERASFKFTHTKLFLELDIAPVLPDTLKKLGVEGIERLAREARKVELLNRGVNLKSLEDSFGELHFREKIDFITRLLQMKLETPDHYCIIRGIALGPKANPALEIAWKNLVKNHGSQPETIKIAKKILKLDNYNAALINNKETTNKISNDELKELAGHSQASNTLYSLMRSRFDHEEPALQKLAKARLLNGENFVDFRDLSKQSFSQKELAHLRQEALELKFKLDARPYNGPLIGGTSSTESRYMPRFKTLFQFLTSHLGLEDEDTASLVFHTLQNDGAKSLIYPGYEYNFDLLCEDLRAEWDMELFKEIAEKALGYDLGAKQRLFNLLEI